jgi:hypothetical protein
MRKETRFYDTFPLVILAGTEAEVTIRPLFEHARLEGDLRVVISPLEGLPGQTGRVEPAEAAFSLTDRVLRVRAAFPTEQEYALLVYQGQEVKPRVEFRLYALREDLFGRRPYKGDIHMHTTYSDGKEAPAFVAAACRQIGIDFAAITDHAKYAPSLEAIRAFAGLPIDLRLFPGEEVHPPDNPVHMINFGGRLSVNARFGEEAYETEVQALAAQLDHLPPGLNRYTLASCMWCFDQIRSAGGLGIFCHPYWMFNHRLDVPMALTDLLFEHRPFDALEVIGGFYPFEFEANGLQVARYHEERARGKQIPIVGASDSHGVFNAELFGWYYTIAFSPSLELPDLIASIKELYAVAIETPPGHAPRAHGPLRLSQYAQFLLREIFPLHDALCADEGRAMLAFVAGDRAAEEMLARLQGQVEKLYHRLWGHPRP